MALLMDGSVIKHRAFGLNKVTATRRGRKWAMKNGYGVVYGTYIGQHRE